MFENILVEEVRFPRQISVEARDLLGGLLVKVIQNLIFTVLKIRGSENG
jgi:hypothetical protein